MLYREKSPIAKTLLRVAPESTKLPEGKTHIRFKLFKDFSFLTMFLRGKADLFIGYTRISRIEDE